jgi:OOP family OmpA-OmpF porin
MPVTTGPKPNVAARRLAGAVIAAFAAVSGTALAQSQQPQPGYVTSTTGNNVMSNYGECWRGGSAPQGQAACPPAATRSSTAAVGAAPERTQLAQSGSRDRLAPAAGVGATPASAGAGAGVMEQGYVNSPEGVNVRNPYGQCWRGGSWTPAMASEPCDATARASAPAPVVAAAPQPEPAPAPKAQPEPAPLVQAEPPRPVLQKVTLSTDVLFEFNKAELREGGKQKLDEIAAGLKDAKVDEIVAIGHADRIASEQYNRKLSEERAQAVKTYLAQKGFGEDKVRVEGRGEEQPVTGDDCAKMGPERASNKKLVNCLQPDRRVEIEVFGTREVAASGEQPAAGATTGTTGSTTSGSSGSSGSAR